MKLSQSTRFQKECISPIANRCESLIPGTSHSFWKTGKLWKNCPHRMAPCFATGLQTLTWATREVVKNAVLTIPQPASDRLWNLGKPAAQLLLLYHASCGICRCHWWASLSWDYWLINLLSSLYNIIIRLHDYRCNLKSNTFVYLACSHKSAKHKSLDIKKL